MATSRCAHLLTIDAGSSSIKFALFTFRPPLERAAHRCCIEQHGIVLPEILDWRWRGATPAASR